jgi:phosphatidylglycerophosphate synthase
MEGRPQSVVVFRTDALSEVAIMDTMLLFTRFWLLLAAVGGAVLPVALGNEPSRKRAVVQVVCGAMMAIFLAPMLEQRFLPDSPAQIQAGVSFLVGCFGLQLTTFIQRLIATHGESWANRIIDRLTGGNPS